MERVKSFNVIFYDFNSKKFVPYDVIPHLVDRYKTAEKKPGTFDEFKEFIKNESLYQWWSRCEYEIVLQSWPNGDLEKKIDIHWQVMMNIDLITELLMECTAKSTD